MKGAEEKTMVTIRLAAEQDYGAVERIMKQVQRMHVDWRPDIYMDTDPVLPYARYLAHLAEQQIYDSDFRTTPGTAKAVLYFFNCQLKEDFL